MILQRARQRGKRGEFIATKGAGGFTERTHAAVSAP
jgi:hypothetical protein